MSPKDSVSGPFSALNSTSLNLKKGGAIDESCCSEDCHGLNQKHHPDTFGLLYGLLKKTWDQHKGTVYGFVKTLLVLFLFIFIKRAI